MRGRCRQSLIAHRCHALEKGTPVQAGLGQALATMAPNAPARSRAVLASGLVAIGQIRSKPTCLDAATALTVLQARRCRAPIGASQSVANLRCQRARLLRWLAVVCPSELVTRHGNAPPRGGATKDQALAQSSGSKALHFGTLKFVQQRVAELNGWFANQRHKLRNHCLAQSTWKKTVARVAAVLQRLAGLSRRHRQPQA